MPSSSIHAQAWLLLLFISVCIRTHLCSAADDLIRSFPASAMVLPLALSINSSRPSIEGNFRRLLRRETIHNTPDARMRLYDDLLANGYFSSLFWSQRQFGVFSIDRRNLGFSWVSRDSFRCPSSWVLRLSNLSCLDVPLFAICFQVFNNTVDGSIGNCVSWEFSDLYIVSSYRGFSFLCHPRSDNNQFYQKGSKQPQVACFDFDFDLSSSLQVLHDPAFYWDAASGICADCRYREYCYICTLQHVWTVRLASGELEFRISICFDMMAVTDLFFVTFLLCDYWWVCVEFS